MAGGRVRRRTKRIRTCFRSEQLRALESYFAQKHNPDGKDWTCLAHKTGLPKRVLQVWFQNARAKLRRSLSTDDSAASSPAAAPRGVSMATGSSPQSGPAPGPVLHFHTSTIDHMQLSLLTAPLADPAQTPTGTGGQALQSPSFLLDYDSQAAPACASSLEAYRDFGEAGGGAEGGADPDSFSPFYC
ncbi:LIM/homeobox protein Lhx2-like isoform X2 [Genypterus blacodes]|uniref:LIM/homeobox protein Lhx2-like isoform X2 n=1 Tax=Genypterus blacodes TaxID=154954 RepID=UPI003F76D6DF